MCAQQWIPDNNIIYRDTHYCTNHHRQINNIKSAISSFETIMGNRNNYNRSQTALRNNKTSVPLPPIPYSEGNYRTVPYSDGPYGSIPASYSEANCVSPLLMMANGSPTHTYATPDYYQLQHD